MLDILSGLFAGARFSLRQQIQTISRLRIVLQTVPKNRKLYGDYLAVLVFIREWKPHYYYGILNRSGNIDEILNELLSMPEIEDTQDYWNWKSYIVIVLLGTAHELRMSSERLERYKSLMKTGNKDFGSSPKEQEIVGNLKHQIGEIQRWRPFAVTRNRIDLVENLVSSEEESG